MTEAFPIESRLELFKALHDGKAQLAELDTEIAAKRDELAEEERKLQAARALEVAIETHVAELTQELGALRAGAAAVHRQAQADLAQVHAEVLALRRERDGLQAGMLSARAERDRWVEKCRPKRGDTSR
jgi:hypothetical protein